MSAAPNLQNQMINALDRVALRLMNQLEGYDPGAHCPKCNETTIPATLSSAEVLRIFDRCEKWLKESKKLRPQGDEGEGKGLKIYQEILENAAKAEDQKAFNELIKFGRPINGVQAPPPKAGRPTAEEARQRDKYHRAAWKQVLKDRDNTLQSIADKLREASAEEYEET
jgi:hypothetical protein